MNILKQLREQKKVYQKDVAKYLGVDRTTYVKYENGDSTPNPDMLVKLSDYFGVSTDYLLGKTENLTLDEQLEGLDFALFGEVKDLTDAQKQDILDYARFKKAQWEKGNGTENK